MFYFYWENVLLQERERERIQVLVAGAAQAVAKSDRDSRVGQKWDRSTKTFPRVIEIALCGSSIDASL